MNHFDTNLIKIQSVVIEVLFISCLVLFLAAGRWRASWNASSLVYPISLHGCGCWGTSDDFTTTPFHFVLSSAALVELAKSNPVHSLILSSHLFFCLLLLLFPIIVPCKIVFAKPKDLETRPNHLSFRFF